MYNCTVGHGYYPGSDNRQKNLCSLGHAFSRNGHHHKRASAVCVFHIGKETVFMNRQNKSFSTCSDSFPWWSLYTTQGFLQVINSLCLEFRQQWPGHTAFEWFLFPGLSRCACGQLTTHHVAIPPGANSLEEANQLVHIDTPKDKWSVVKHTRTYPTDSYGVIEFQGGGFINKAMVSFNTENDLEVDLHEVTTWEQWIDMVWLNSFTYLS